MPGPAQARLHPARRLRNGAALLTVALLASGAALASGLVTAGPASADGTFDSTQWYYTNFNMAANHTRANGTGVKVAVVDGPLDTSVPELAGAHIVTEPASRCFGPDAAALPSTGTGTDTDHATKIAVMLVGNGTGTYEGRGGSGVAPGVTLLHYVNGVNAHDPADPIGVRCNDAAGAGIDDEATATAIDDAVAAGARVVSLSVGTEAAQPKTAVAIGRAENAGLVIVAATNDQPAASGDRIDQPESFNGVVAVNGIKTDSSLAANSAISALVSVAAPGDNLGLGGHDPATGAWSSFYYDVGSSFATPFTAGVVADAMSAYPQATSNQILQLLLRTTGGTLHDLQRSADGFGFGVPSLTTMLENDPVQFPDENPLLRDGADPSTSDILGTDTATPAPSSPTSAGAPATASSTPARAADQDSASDAPWLLIAVVVAVLLIGAAVTVIVVVARRRSRTGPPTAPPPYVRT